MLNITHNISTYMKVVSKGQLQDIQLNVCKHYNNNVLYPLILSIVCLLIRWFVIYKLMDKYKYPRLFQLLEILLDVGVLFGMIVSIIWMKII